MTISTHVLGGMRRHAIAPSTRPRVHASGPRVHASGPRVHASAAARASALQVGKSSHKGHRGLNVKDLETQHAHID